MYLQSIQNIKKIHLLNDAAVARMAGISRAAVHRWFAESPSADWVNVETATLMQLAQSLSITPDYFLQKKMRLDPYETQFLWDALYPDMESFCLALVQNQMPALARLVQILGFHEAGSVVGNRVLTEFVRYKKYIKPIRRKQLEILWPIYSRT